MKNRWNQLDFLICILSIFGIFFELFSNKTILKPTIIRTLRILLVIRILKIFKIAKGLRSLTDTVVKALPEVRNLGFLFILIFYMFAALGVEMFGRLCKIIFLKH